MKPWSERVAAVISAHHGTDQPGLSDRARDELLRQIALAVPNVEGLHRANPDEYSAQRLDMQKVRTKALHAALAARHYVIFWNGLFKPYVDELEQLGQPMDIDPLITGSRDAPMVGILLDTAPDTELGQALAKLAALEPPRLTLVPSVSAPRESGEQTPLLTDFCGGWSFPDGHFDSLEDFRRALGDLLDRSDTAFDEIVITASRIRVHWEEGFEYSDGYDSLALFLIVSARQETGLTAGEILRSIHNALQSRLHATEHRYFEGLHPYKPEWVEGCPDDDVRLFHLHLGS